MALERILTSSFYALMQRVFLPKTFLTFTLPSKTEVGCVGINKRVRRVISIISFAHFWKFICCLQFGWHTSDNAAENMINGGVFVVSGRTSAHRTQILEEESFRAGLTRSTGYMVRQNWSPEQVCRIIPNSSSTTFWAGFWNPMAA